MIDVTIKMTVPADKRIEVLQTIGDLLKPIRGQQDCISCHCFVDIENENVLCLKQQWKTDEALAVHLRSPHFSVLLGATKLLPVEPEILFSTVLATQGKEIVAAAREDETRLVSLSHHKEALTRVSTERRSPCSR